MPAMFLLALAAAQSGPNLVIHDPPRGPMPAEEHSLSQPHRNMDDRMFPDMAVKDMRIDGDTLFVLVKNEGGVRAKGPIRVAAEAVASGVHSTAPAARLDKLAAGESRWVSLRGFSVQTASTGKAPLVALQNAALVSASVALPREVPAGLDRSGRGSDSIATDFDEANNSLSLSGDRIVRGRPE